MKLNFHNALWRSRAVAILGFVIMLIIIFPGLPSALKTTFLLALGLAITCLGFAGSRRHAYVSTDETTNEEVVIESQVIELPDESEAAFAQSSGEPKEESTDQNL